jgi:hypothetical protein
LMMDIGGGNMGKKPWRTANIPGLLEINLILSYSKQKEKNPCII